MTVNTLTEICRVPCAVSQADGKMTVLLQSDSGSAQDLLQGFALHLRELSREYPKQLKIIYGGNHHA